MQLISRVTSVGFFAWQEAGFSPVSTRIEPHEDVLAGWLLDDDSDSIRIHKISDEALDFIEGLQKLSGEPSGEDINITDDNNDDRIVESTLVCQSHTEIIQPSFVPDQFESDSDVEFQTSTSKNLNTAKKPNKCKTKQMSIIISCLNNLITIF